MDQKELDRKREIYTSEHSLNPGNCIPMPKSELVVGKIYRGVCRNSDTAEWDGEKFWYDRYKFGSVYRESINHYEDDDGYDVFVPFEVAE